jgi:predicted DNA-binding antitoxin AbrB/MazE fold protein
MQKRFDVIYENGVFRPLEPVTVRERQHGTVTLGGLEEDWLDTAYMDRCGTEVRENVSLETTRHILSKIPESLAGEIRADRDGR